MLDNWPLKAATFLFVILLVAVLAWLTLPEEQEPCAQQQTDISAAAIADDGGDQDALVNRAIILRGKCGKDAEDQKDQ